MKIQRSRRGRTAASSTSPIYKHFVLIPKRLADGAGVMGGTILHMSPPASGGRTCLLHKRSGEGRMPVTVTEQVTKRIGDERYTSLKFVIPEALVRSLSLESGDDAEMSAVPGVGLAVRFGRARREPLVGRPPMQHVPRLARHARTVQHVRAATLRCKHSEQ